LTTSPAGIALIEEYEGLRLRSYQDQAGIWTLGYGHVQPGITAGCFESQAAAEADLCKDLATAESAVARLVTVPLTQGQWDALVSFTYNEGQGRLAGSTLLKKLNAGDYAGASAAFGSWEMIAGEHSEGLERRREAEIALFLGSGPNAA
jgi:lysozyme